MEHQKWLTIHYTLPKGPSRMRVNVWRKLRKKGAVMLGQSVWVLPVTEDNELFLHEISTEVHTHGGNAYLMSMQSLDQNTSDHITKAFQPGERDPEPCPLIP